MHILHLPDHSLPQPRCYTCAMLPVLKQPPGGTPDRCWFDSIRCGAAIHHRLTEAGVPT